MILRTLPLTSATSQKETCEDISVLGTPSLHRFDVDLDLKVDRTQHYTLTFSFKHDDSQPLPDNPAQQCDPAFFPPILADDGLPYYAFRWYWESVPSYVTAATNIDHISLDFNPCGHPPVDLFTIPHYDMHVYRVSPEFRTCMTCDIEPMDIVCAYPKDDSEDVPQSTLSGFRFFNPATMTNGKLSNMPDGFKLGLSSGVPYMGGHAWNFETEPASPQDWKDPIWIMGPYDGGMGDYEPMFPLSFVTGDQDNFYEESLSYVGQTIEELPTYYSVEYKPRNGYTSVTFKGKSLISKRKLDRLKRRDRRKPRNYV